MKEYKIYDNGNKCIIINEYEDGYDFDFEQLIGDDEKGFGILGCNLRSYSIEHHNGFVKDTRDFFDWVYREKKVSKINFSVEELINAYGSDTYINEDGEDAKIEVANNSVLAMRDLVLNMFYNDCFDDGDLFKIISLTEFEDIIVKPFYAYIHSGVSLSLRDYKDPWDSGVAGFTWYELHNDETLEEAEKYFLEDFSTYDDYVQGMYNEYHIQEFEKKDGNWEVVSDFWSFERSFEDAWGCCEEITNEVENFSKEDEIIVRTKMNVDTYKILDYLSEEL